MLDTDFVLRALKNARPPGTPPQLISTKDYLPVPGEYTVLITETGEILVGWLYMSKDSVSGVMRPHWEGRRLGADGLSSFGFKDITHWLG